MRTFWRCSNCGESGQVTHKLPDYYGAWSLVVAAHPKCLSTGITMDAREWREPAPQEGN